MPPTVAVVAPGAMGAALGARLVNVGHCTVYTVLAGRSQASYRRAKEAGLIDVPLADFSSRAEWVLSVLPPSQAHDFAEAFLASRSSQETTTRVFVDCNAVSPATVRNISSLFSGSGIAFLDAGIIGLPPNGDYEPTIYASADLADAEHLDAFERFNELGLKIRALRGGDNVEAAGIGDASALKMSYAGISKGLTGIVSTIILAAHASSPATASALLTELSLSQPAVLKRTGTAVPGMIPKAYRWVKEMEEIADFIDTGLVPESDRVNRDVVENGVKEGSGEVKTPGDIYRGLAALYARVQSELEQNGREAGDVHTLLDFATEARRVSESSTAPK